MSMEIKALKSILAIKGLELPTDVEAANPVSEFVSEQFTETFSTDNEMIVILRDLFVNRANENPKMVLRAILQFNSAVVEFSQKDETIAYVDELNANTD